LEATLESKLKLKDSVQSIKKKRSELTQSREKKLKIREPKLTMMAKANKSRGRTFKELSFEDRNWVLMSIITKMKRIEIAPM